MAEPPPKLQSQNGKAPTFVPFTIHRPTDPPQPGGQSSNRMQNTPTVPERSRNRHVSAYQKAKDDYVRLMSNGGKMPEVGDEHGRRRDEQGGEKERARKRLKRSSGKACVYCRRR